MRIRYLILARMGYDFSQNDKDTHPRCRPADQSKLSQSRRGESENFCVQLVPAMRDVIINRYK